jgi:hypothetical protein
MESIEECNVSHERKDATLWGEEEHNNQHGMCRWQSVRWCNRMFRLFFDTYIFNQFGLHVFSVLNIKAHKWHFIVYKMIYVIEFAVCTWLHCNLRYLHITNHVTDDNILMVCKGHAFFWNSKVNHCFMRSVGLFGLKLCAKLLQ